MGGRNSVACVDAALAAAAETPMSAEELAALAPDGPLEELFKANAEAKPWRDLPQPGPDIDLPAGLILASYAA